MEMENPGGPWPSLEKITQEETVHGKEWGLLLIQAGKAGPSLSQSGRVNRSRPPPRSFTGRGISFKSPSIGSDGPPPKSGAGFSCSRSLQWKPPEHPRDPRPRPG
jgi:hypothetical protein